MKKVYIIKSLAPWMIDELKVFSQQTNFDILFLRKQEDFYKEDILELQKNNTKVTFLSTSYSHFFKKISVVFKFIIKNLSSFLSFDYNFVLGFKSILWFMKLDVDKFSKESNMHAQFATQASLVAILIKQFYNNKPSFSFTFHAYDIYFNNKWFNMLLNQCVKSFSISEFNINYVKKTYLDSDKITLARLGVFSNILDKSLYKKDKVFKIGLMSWFVEKKGITFLLKSIKELKSKGYNDIELILAGDGPLKEDFLTFISQNNLADNIKYLGKIKGDQKKEFFNKIDIFVLPSISLDNDMDGIPVVLMEAIMASKPIISTNISGIPEICINEYNGYLINEKSVEEITNSIEKLINNEEILNKMSENSLELGEKYNIETNTVEKMKEINWI